MFERIYFPIKLIIVVGCMALLSSCAVFTRSMEGTSETLQNTTDVSTDFTSSTSPRYEDKHSEDQKVKAFAAVNHDRLKEDMARGSGEHLTAFAHLLGIKDTHKSDFFTLTKQNYPVLFSSESTNPEDMLARLNTELNNYPTWRQ